MSRDADKNSFVTTGQTRTSAATTTAYFPVEYDILVHSMVVVGINPAAQDNDTVNFIWEYTAPDATNTLGDTWVEISDTQAFEYNDTTDTNSLGVLASGSAKMVDFDVDSTGTLAFPGTRVAKGSLIRCREVWAGTVTDGAAVSALFYAPIGTQSGSS